MSGYTVTPTSVGDDGTPGGYTVEAGFDGFDSAKQGTWSPDNLPQELVEADAYAPGDLYNDDEYVGALFEANPDLAAATEWAGRNMSPEWCDLYDSKVNSDDLGEVNEWIDKLLDEYRNRTTDGPTTNKDETPELTLETLNDEQRAFASEAVDSLSQMPVLGDETAAAWDEQVEYANSIGDSTYAGMSAAAAAFHAGDVSADEAINFVLENYPLTDVYRIYSHWQRSGLC